MEDEIIGSFVKLIKPEFTKTFGQGNPPEGLKINTEKGNYFFPWESVLKLSDTCDPVNQVADLGQRPYPLLHIKFYRENINSFEIINNERSSDNE